MLYYLLTSLWQVLYKYVYGLSPLTYSCLLPSITEFFVYVLEMRFFFGITISPLFLYMMMFLQFDMFSG